MKVNDRRSCLEKQLAALRKLRQEYNGAVETLPKAGLRIVRKPEPTTQFQKELERFKRISEAA